MSLTSPLPELAPLDAYALWSSNYPARAHNPVMMAEERAMLSLMPEQLRGRHVLDAGCGSGRYLLHALRRGAPRVTGVDLSPAMLERAREAMGEHAGDAPVDLRQGDLVAMPVPGSMADLTLCGLTIGHLEALTPALAAAILDLLHASHRASTMGRAARAWVETHGSMEAMAARYGQLYFGDMERAS